MNFKNLFFIHLGPEAKAENLILADKQVTLEL